MQRDGESLCVARPAGVHGLAVRPLSASLQILAHISRLLLMRLPGTVGRPTMGLRQRPAPAALTFTVFGGGGNTDATSS